MPRRLIPLALAALLGIGTLSGCERIFPPAPEPTGALVTRVSDGDSIVVTIHGTEQRVRLLGVDAPEHGECGSDAAADRLRELIDDRQVEIIADPEADPIDRHGRILGYVEVDGVDAGGTMIAEGYAAAWWPASAVEPERGADYLKAQRAAERADLGSWASCEMLGRP